MTEHNDRSTRKPFVFGKFTSGHIYGAVLLFAVIVVIVIIATFYSGDPSDKESLLLGILLTVFSTVASWMITHAFYQSDRNQQIDAIRKEYENNLKTYALKASEKLINLSDQISRVISFQQDFDESDELDFEFEYNILLERMSASSHMLETLKSITETSLSDWEGVIGEQLARRRLLEESRNEDVNAILEEMKRAVSENHQQANDEFKTMFKELKTLVRNPTSLPLARAELAGLCPKCDDTVMLKVNKRGKVVTGVRSCSKCKSDLVVNINRLGQVKIEERKNIPETIRCPDCDAPQVVSLDNAVGGHTPAVCDKCSAKINVSRSPSGISVKTAARKIVQNAGDLEAIDEQVLMLLPEQPWPTGIHREIAEKLGLRNSEITRSISRLIDSGMVLNQQDGQVVLPVSGENDASPVATSDDSGSSN